MFYIWIKLIHRHLCSTCSQVYNILVFKPRYLNHGYLSLGTQQTEDPRVLWKEQQRNMIKQYLELAQNDLTVSTLDWRFHSESILINAFDDRIHHNVYHITWNSPWSFIFNELPDRFHQFFLRKYLEFYYILPLNLMIITSVRCGCDLRGFLFNYLAIGAFLCFGDYLVADRDCFRGIIHLTLCSFSSHSTH